MKYSSDVITAGKRVVSVYTMLKYSTWNNYKLIKICKRNHKFNNHVFITVI